LCDDFLEVLESSSLAYPGNAELVGEMAVIGLVKKLGPTLKHLDFSGVTSITDEFFLQYLKEHDSNLESLTMVNSWGIDRREDWPVLLRVGGESRVDFVDLSRNHTLSSLALDGVLHHSEPQLKLLNINGWKATSNESLSMIAELATDLSKIDVRWCHEVDDFALTKV
jgi:DNA repair protein RAD7